MGFINKMAPGLSEGILNMNLGLKTFHQVRFSRKKVIEIPKSSVYSHFLKIVDMLESSLLSEIDYLK